MATISNKCLLVLILVALSSTSCKSQRTDNVYGKVSTAPDNETLYYTRPPLYVMINSNTTRTTLPTPTTTEDLPVLMSRPLESPPDEIPAQYRINITLIEEVTGLVSTTVVCIANKPLRTCMLQLPGVPTVNYTQGFRFIRGAAYEYRARGLVNGECGVRFLTLPAPARGEFRCSGSYRDGRIDMTLHFSTTRTYPFGVHLRSDGHMLSATVGRAVSIPCVSSVYHALTSCHFWVPDIRHLDLHFGEFSDTSPAHAYEGEGLRRGQCGLRLKSLKKQHGGVVMCWGGVDKDRIAVDTLDFQVEDGLSDGTIAGIALVVVGFFVAGAVLVFGWWKERWFFSSGNGNADSDTEYDEIRNFAPKVPPYPTPQRLHLMAPSPHDSAYIEAVTIHNPEFDKHKGNLSPPIKETHSIESRPSANQAQANVYEHLKEPQVKAAEKTQSVQEKVVERETDSVLQARPGTYMFMRGVPPKAAESKMEHPKYLSLLDPEAVKMRRSKREQEDKTDTLYENLERVREKNTSMQDHPMFD